MMRFAVIGDPIEHSLSPTIHKAFAEQCGIDLAYERMRVTPDSFDDEVNEFFSAGGRGLNVTQPLKTLAFNYAELVTDRAMNAGAANTLKFLDNDMVCADNTDGEGLVQDLHALGVSLNGKRVLLLGAGGAARGSVGTLLGEQPATLCIHNRTEATALQLIDDYARLGKVDWLGSATSEAEFDVIINATSASLHGARPDIDHALFTGAVCYDMMYGDNARPFTKWALANGAKAAHDGLGMLIEQAAASFMLWHNIQPDTARVRKQLSQAQSHSR